MNAFHRINEVSQKWGIVKRNIVHSSLYKIYKDLFCIGLSLFIFPARLPGLDLGLKLSRLVVPVSAKDRDRTSSHIVKCG